MSDVLFVTIKYKWLSWFGSEMIPRGSCFEGLTQGCRIEWEEVKVIGCLALPVVCLLGTVM